MDVVEFFPEISPAANDIVEIPRLSDRSCRMRSLSDFKACLALQVAQDLSERLLPRHQEQMHMIGHYHIAEKEETAPRPLSLQDGEKKIPFNVR